MQNSIILQTAMRLLIPVILLFSIHLLLVGHHTPGGGFAGGLVAAGAYALYAISYGIREARNALPVQPLTLLVTGLFCSLISGIIPLLVGKAFLEGMWGVIPVIEVKVGTPLIFDIGVYFIVIGMTLTAIFELEDAFRRRTAEQDKVTKEDVERTRH